MCTCSALRPFFIVLTLFGVEFSVSAFVNPAAWQLKAESQSKILGRLALVLGKVMPVWYPISALLTGVQTWLRWNTRGWRLRSFSSRFAHIPASRKRMGQERPRSGSE